MKGSDMRLLDRIISRIANGNIFEVCTVPLDTNPFAYGSKLAEIDRRLGKSVATYEVVSRHRDILVSCSTPDRWNELVAMYPDGDRK
jgi:hypothetical protein